MLFEANDKKTPLELLPDDNFHLTYFREYLGSAGVKARFVVQESEYISIDYLTDYAYYYAESFDEYKRKCVRLHFFTYCDEDQQAFDSELELAILQGNDYSNGKVNSFWDKYYLGFIVIRPIPKFMIGYTILRHYNYRSDAPNFEAGRQFWGTKTYDVHVFGTHVRLESLAFLSQDSNVAACATIAVWCMLQRAVENYYINLKSPYEITQDAGLTIHDGNRIFPNSGLDIYSIANAITKSNLATEIIDLEGQNRNKIAHIKKYVNAYSKLKLPIILGIKVPVKGEMERHAVAICGHHTNSQILTKRQQVWARFKRTLGRKKPYQPMLRCNSIDKLYMHDDQWGPFSRAEFVDRTKMSTSWSKLPAKTHLSVPITLIIPVFTQVRISYQDIEDHTICLNQFIMDAVAGELTGELTWDIQLHFSAEFKDEVREAGLFDLNDVGQKNVFLNFMAVSMPKYIWVSTLYINDYKTLHFVYDATGLRHTSSLLFSLCYYPDVQEKFVALLNRYGKRKLSESGARSVLETLLMDSVSGFLQKFNRFNFRTP